LQKTLTGICSETEGKLRDEKTNRTGCTQTQNEDGRKKNTRTTGPGERQEEEYRVCGGRTKNMFVCWYVHLIGHGGENAEPALVAAGEAIPTPSQTPWHTHHVPPNKCIGSLSEHWPTNGDTWHENTTTPRLVRRALLQLAIGETAECRYA